MIKAQDTRILFFFFCPRLPVLVLLDSWRCRRDGGLKQVETANDCLGLAYAGGDYSPRGRGRLTSTTWGGQCRIKRGAWKGGFINRKSMNWDEQELREKNGGL